MMKLRYELAISRIREMMDEETVEEKFRDYFRTVGKFILLIDETNRKLKDGSFEKYSMEELKAWNTKLYEDILADTYNISYGNPAYAVEKLGAEYGSVLSALYAEIRGAISYVYEQNVEYLDILFELFIEVYNQFEGEPSIKNIKDTIYWYASDYCDVFVADRIIDQVDANRSFAADIIRQSDLTDLRYLYSFGEYISDSELRTARHLLELDESVIVKMADVYTEGYRIGFVNTGKDLSKKKTVNIRYVLGFERVVKKAIENFEKMDMKVSMEPVPFKVLPCDKYILKNNGNTYPFYYQTKVYVTLPKGIKKSQLNKRQAVLQNAVGPLRLKSKYYYKKQMVGWGMQYERNIVSDLLLTS